MECCDYLFGIRYVYTLSSFSIKFPLVKWTCNTASRNCSSRSEACAKMWTIQISNKYCIWCFLITSKNSKMLSYSMNFLYLSLFNLSSIIRNWQDMGKSISKIVRMSLCNHKLSNLHLDFQLWRTNHLEMVGVYFQVYVAFFVDSRLIFGSKNEKRFIPEY